MEDKTTGERVIGWVAVLFVVVGWMILFYAAWSTTSFAYNEEIAKAFVRGIFLCFFGACCFTIVEEKYEETWAKAIYVVFGTIVFVAIGAGSGFLIRWFWEAFRWAFLT